MKLFGWIFRSLLGLSRVQKIVIGAATSLLLAYFLLFNYVEQYEVGAGWNMVTGELFLQPSGMHITGPFTIVSRIDTRPQRVCLTSAGHAVFNCKLVQFVPENYRDFVAVEGHYWYWWANRISFNMGYHDEYRGMKDLLRGYSFSSNKYPFIRVLTETSSQ